MFFRRRVMRVSLRENNFHLRHGDHRCESNEEKEERSENAERPNESPNIDPGREEESPGRRQEVAVQSADDDDETLEPHAGVHAHADEVNDIDVVAAPLEPKQLRRKEIAEEHSHPPVPPVGTEDAVIEGKLLVLIAAVPGDEKFHRVGVTDN